jgi:sec-independent protein translocase protein TatC
MMSTDTEKREIVSTDSQGAGSARGDDREMTIWEHLTELRNRLLVAVLALVAGTLIGMAFAGQGLDLLKRSLGAAVVQAITPTEPLVVYFRLALIMGAALSMPVIVYELVAYALPGLEPHERRYLYFLLPGVVVCFVLGVTFAVLVMLPAMVTFLQTIFSNVFEIRWTVESTFNLVTNVMFWDGIVFEMPLVMYFLAKLGVVTPRKLSSFRKFAIVINAIVAAVVTPTPDPFNMMVVMIPLVLLYEVGILLSRVAVAGRKEA